MPKAFTYGAGVLIAAALMFATGVATVWLDQNRVGQRHHEAIQIFKLSTSESTRLLNHLLSHDKLDCRPADLIHLNTHLLQSRYIREIGILDAQGRLVCSTGVGQLDRPFKSNYPVYVTRSGLELLNNIPLVMSNRTLRAIVIQAPPFNVALSPYASDDIYSQADIVWLRTTDRLVLLHANIAAKDIPAMGARARLQEGSSFQLDGLGYELITTTPDLDLMLQTRRNLGTIVQESGMLLPAMLAGSLLIAVLAVGTITPWVMGLSKLQNRIGFLCNETHLALVYQPVFDLHTLRPVGCEVLARLKEGGKSWTPDKIIPAIQAAGLEREFDHAVTRKAIRDLAAHLPVGIPVDRDHRFRDRDRAVRHRDHRFR